MSRFLATQQVLTDGQFGEEQCDSNGYELDHPVQPILGVARQLAAGIASANTALSTTAKEIDITARTADIRFAIGSTAQTASATSHFIAAGQAKRIRLPATPNIAVIRHAATDGVLEVSELLW